MDHGPHRRIVYQDIYAADGVVAACEGLQVLGLKSWGCPLPAALYPALLLVPPSRLIGLQALSWLRRSCLIPTAATSMRVNIAYLSVQDFVLLILEKQARARISTALYVSGRFA